MYNWSTQEAAAYTNEYTQLQHTKTRPPGRQCLPLTSRLVVESLNLSTDVV